MSVVEPLLFTESPTADGKADCSTTGYRQQNCSCWVLEQKARKREGGDVCSHVGGRSCVVHQSTVSNAKLTNNRRRLSQDLILASSCLAIAMRLRNPASCNRACLGRSFLRTRTFDPLAVLRACLTRCALGSFQPARPPRHLLTLHRLPPSRAQDTLHHPRECIRSISAAASSCSYLPFVPGSCYSSP